MLLIALSVTGCSLLPVRTEFVTVSPPAELLQRCEPADTARVRDNRDVALVILRLRHAWAECNTKHDALVNWIVATPE